MKNDRDKLPIIVDEWKAQAKGAMMMVAGLALVLLAILAAVLKRL